MISCSYYTATNTVGPSAFTYEPTTETNKFEPALLMLIELNVIKFQNCFPEMNTILKYFKVLTSRT